MPGTQKCFTFDKIKCLDPKSNTGGDDIYMKATVDGGRDERFPDKGTFADNMQSGDETPPLNIPFTFQDSVYIELFEHDSLGDDDSLGSVNYTPDFLPPVLLVTGSESTYEFHIKDIRDC